MKKVFLSLILMSLMAAPMIALAQPADTCTLRHDIEGFEDCVKDAIVCAETEPIPADCTAPTNEWGACCLLDSVYTTVDWIFFALVAAVALFTILGAFDILTAAGDPEKVGNGRKKIMYAMLGLAVALLSRAVPSLVKAIIGG